MPLEVGSAMPHELARAEGASKGENPAVECGSDKGTDMATTASRGQEMPR